MDIPQLSVIAEVETNTPKLSEAKDQYVRLKGNGRNKAFFQTADRAAAYVKEAIGDRPIASYSSSDAAHFRDWLLERGLSVDSVRRMFASVRPMINLCIRENGLDCSNAFSATYMPDRVNVVKRQPIPDDNIRTIQNQCRRQDDDLRLLVALISDTGMRLSEAVGLLVRDIYLEDPIPHVKLRPHPHRMLKTADSEREIPLVGASLWAAKKVVENSSNEYAFSRYSNERGCNSNSASASTNKWLKAYVPENCVIHSFRHSLRDRLRRIGCPVDIIDQIGGWAVTSVGERYGNRERKRVMLDWMEKMVLDV